MSVRDVHQLRSDLDQFLKSVDDYLIGLKTSESNDRQNSDHLWAANRFHTSNESFGQNRTKELTKTRITFSEFKSELKSISDSFPEFKEIETDLNENIDSFDDKKLSSLISQYCKQNPLLVQKLISIKNKIPLIRRKIRENKRKRSKKYNKNIKHSKLCDKNLENNNKLIEEWIESNKRLNEKIENENDFKKEVNIVLKEIKKKIIDTKRWFKTINLTEKYRNLLKTKARQRNEVISSESDDKFCHEINKIKDLLKQRLVKYRKEENVINNKLRIECRHQLDDQKDRISDELNRRQLSISEALFGSQVFAEPMDSQSIDNWMRFESSHQSLENMLQIRNSWDRYLDMSDGTPIPSHYVMPNTSPDTDWQKYLQN